MKIKLAIATLLFAGLANTASAALINASDYFNELIDNNNTAQLATNTWQLGFFDGTGAFTLFDYRAAGDVVGSGQQASFDSFAAAGSYVGFGVNVSGTDAGYFGDTIAANELYFHPGSGTPDLVLRFFAAVDGLYQFDTTIRNAHTGLVETSVRQGNTTLNTTLIQKGSASLNSATTFLQQLTLNSGSTVDFILNDFDNYFSDGSAINANAGLAGANSGTVQASEPGTVAMLGLALLAIARIRRKA